MSEYPQVRHKVGDVDFNCPNCNRELHRVLWEHASEWDVETKKPTMFDFVEAHAKCRCGALILVADTYERFELYWLNEKEMRRG
jgi:hypothetical protein